MPQKTMINQIVAEPIREHSRKPDIIADNIDLMYPSKTKIEIFARTQRDWWGCFWNEVEKFKTYKKWRTR